MKIVFEMSKYQLLPWIWSLNRRVLAEAHEQVWYS
jgi:hypothetical protein